MTLAQLAAFALAIFLWALLPGPGLVAVLSRALGSGVRAGLFVIVGLLLADVVFLAIAVAGLSALAAVLGPLFQVVKYLGAAYLIWQGYRAIAEASQPLRIEAGPPGLPWRTRYSAC